MTIPLSLAVPIGVALVLGFLNGFHDSAHVVATIFILSELDFNHPKGVFTIWWQSGR